MAVARRSGGDDSHAIDSHAAKEPIMLQRPITRTVSLCLSVLLTLAILGGIDQLSQPGESAAGGGAQWAHAPAPLVIAR